MYGTYLFTAISIFALELRAKCYVCGCNLSSQVPTRHDLFQYGSGLEKDTSIIYSIFFLTEHSKCCTTYDSFINYALILTVPKGRIFRRNL